MLLNNMKASASSTPTEEQRKLAKLVTALIDRECGQSRISEL